MPLQATTALRKIAGLRKRIKVVRGGQGAGKTISILILLINHAAANPDREILIVSSELTKMRLTVIKDFVKVMKLAGIYEERRFLAGTLYRFPNGSFIKFIGLDQEDIGKGLRCDVAYFNEVNKIDFETYRQIASRAKQVFADYNPDAEFFIDTEVVGREDCDFLQLTFMDNELLDEEERKEILMYKERGYDARGNITNKYYANLWQVYGLGNIGNLQGVVFENWSIVDTIPAKAEFVAYGLDFGFTNDPTGFIKVFKNNDDLYFDELIYETRLTNQKIAQRFRELGVNEYDEIIADSAEPKSIEELRFEGFNVIGAMKGPDSIKASIDILQQYNLCVTRNSKNFQREMRGYIYDTDKNGKSINKPIDKDNHCIDPARYVGLNKLSKKWVMDFN
jgi:phage terminase large subunit